MKKYINMTELTNEIKSKSNVPIYSDKKVREKLLELFKIIGIRTEYLQENRKTSGEYRFPQGSVDFLCYLHEFYTKPDGKLFRRGEFDKIDIDVIRELIGNVMEMLKKCDITEDEIDEQEIIIWKHLNFVYLDSRDKIRRQLESMQLDFYPAQREIYGGFSGDPEHPVIQKKSRFRYSLRDIDDIDMFFFFDFVRKDLLNNQMKYRRIYENMVQIRSDEISEEGYRVGKLFTDEDVDNMQDNADKTIELMILLYNDPEYDKLAERHLKLTHSNLFLKQRDKELLDIEKRMREIEKEFEEKYFGGQIDAELDSRFDTEVPEMDPEEVLRKAIEQYLEERKVLKKLFNVIEHGEIELPETNEGSTEARDPEDG